MIQAKVAAVCFVLVVVTLIMGYYADQKFGRSEDWRIASWTFLIAAAFCAVAVISAAWALIKWLFNWQ